MPQDIRRLTPTRHNSTATPQSLETPAEQIIAPPPLDLQDEQYQVPTSQHLTNIQPVPLETGIPGLDQHPLLQNWVQDLQSQYPDTFQTIRIAVSDFIDQFLLNGGHEEYGRLMYPQSLELSKSCLFELPPQLTVEGDVLISQCYNLQAIPKNLVVEGNLSIEKCSRFTSLEAEPQISGNMNIHACPYLSTIHLGDTTQIQGNLLVHDSVKVKDISIQGLHGALVALRLGSLENIQSQQSSLNETDQQKVSVDFTTPRAFVLDSAPNTGSTLTTNLNQENGEVRLSLNVRHQDRLHNKPRFLTLEDGIKFWNLYANQPRQPGMLQSLTQEQRRVLSTFLLHITSTAEFSQHNQLHVLSDRIFRFLDFLGSHHRLQEDMIQSIHHGNRGCGDRTIQSLSQLELDMQIEEARLSDNPREALYNLALGLIRLDIVHQTAFRNTTEENSR